MIYAAAVVDALDRAPGAEVLGWTLLWPTPWFLASLAVPLAVPPVKRWLARYVWMSFERGFGQTAGSVVVGVFLLLAVGVFFYVRAKWEVVGGFVGTNVFSAYAAGIGILAAQAILVRALERVPDIRRRIEETET